MTVAEDVLRQTADVAAEAPAGLIARARIGVGAAADEGWPARLTRRWMAEVFGGVTLGEGLDVRLGPLPEAWGALSFARALGMLATAVLDASQTQIYALFFAQAAARPSPTCPARPLRLDRARASFRSAGAWTGRGSRTGPPPARGHGVVPIASHRCSARPRHGGVVGRRASRARAILRARPHPFCGSCATGPTRRAAEASPCGCAGARWRGGRIRPPRGARGPPRRGLVSQPARDRIDSTRGRVRRFARTHFGGARARCGGVQRSRGTCPLKSQKLVVLNRHAEGLEVNAHAHEDDRRARAGDGATN